MFAAGDYCNLHSSCRSITIHKATLTWQSQCSIIHFRCLSLSFTINLLSMLEWQSRVQTLVCTLFEENIPCGIANSLRWKVALLLTSSGSPLATRANQSWVDHLNREWKKVIVENGMKLRNRTDFIRIHHFPNFCCRHHLFSPCSGRLELRHS